MAVHSKVYENNHDLIVTYSTEPDKYILHKKGTEEYYDDPIDLKDGVYEEGPRQGEPKCRFEYEEVDRPVEEVEDDTSAETTDTTEA